MKQKVTIKRIKFSGLLLLLIIILLVYLIVNFILNIRIKNIYILNNKYIYINNLNSNFNEQMIIEKADLSDYPIAIFTNSKTIKNKLLNDVYIKNVDVKRKGLTTFYITIYENRPLFYDDNKHKTVLETKEEVDDKFNVPILINYVPDKVYNEFINVMNSIDDSVLSHISEIKYDPNNVDEERFLFTMTDGNYVYITISRFSMINNYIDIIAEIGNKKGILYLDYGDHFVFE